MNIVGKFVDVAGFRSHVASLQFGAWRPQFIVVHNTSAPTLANYAEWRAHPEKHGNWTPEQWGRNLASYYSGLGWSAGPHCFVCPDGILLFTPFTQRGTHSPSWNSISLGIETVGEFEREQFTGGIREHLIQTLAILHDQLAINVNSLRFHREDPNTTHKTCPGRAIVKARLIADVWEAMPHGDHVYVPTAVHIAPTSGLNPDEMTSTVWLQAALSKLSFGPLVMDGIVGPRTREAVKAFQKAFGLVVDGIAGPVTRKRLKVEIQQT